MDELTTHVLSEELLKQLRPLVKELGEQETQLRRLALINGIMQEHLRLLIMRELGIDITTEQPMQLDITRGIVRL